MTEPQPAPSDRVGTLTELLERTTSKRFLDAAPPEDLGLADSTVYPFLALVGQREMKLALLLALINPRVGGVLLIGPRGTGKTTAVRSLSDLTPPVPRSLCPYGCLPEDVMTGGIDSICPDCARRFASNDPLTYEDRVRLIELPLNARLEDVVGGLDERAAVHQRLRLRRGILARADQNLLYVDEVNLLADEVVDSILDAAAQGIYTVQRGPMAAVYRARFILVGSMNPEEGRLRPQILDRFGLRVLVRGLTDEPDRLEAYRRAVAFQTSPRSMAMAYADATQSAANEVAEARALLPEVSLSAGAEKLGLQLIREMDIESLRAEITLFESAKAHAVADGRRQAKEADIRAVATLALRMRRSAYMAGFLKEQEKEDRLLAGMLRPGSPQRPAKTRAGKPKSGRSPRTQTGRR
jgi:magnesium chelatase subunit I